jgi:hypothetical protein
MNRKRVEWRMLTCGPPFYPKSLAGLCDESVNDITVNAITISLSLAFLSYWKL